MVESSIFPEGPMGHGHDGGSAAEDALTVAVPAIDPIGPNTAGRGHFFDPSILRAYDIRGTVGRTLCDTDAYFVGRAFGPIVGRDGGNRVIVGNDGRMSSLALAAALSDGLAASGVSVLALGLASSSKC
jgi:hypothetical protein